MNTLPLSQRSGYREENRPASMPRKLGDKDAASLLGERELNGERDCAPLMEAGDFSKLLKADCSGSTFKSGFTVEQIASMKRRHPLTHPWQRGYRNHKAVKQAIESK